MEAPLLHFQYLKMMMKQQMQELLHLQKMGMTLVQLILQAEPRILLPHQV